MFLLNKIFFLKAPGNKTATVAATPVTVNQANIYVSKHFPAWQQIILDSLRKLYSVNNSFPDNKVILAEINTKEEVKKYQKKSMPFVAYLKVTQIKLLLFIKII